MFFLMGISNREREKGAYFLPCPRCHQRCLMTVTAQGHFFHLFFIPLSPFGTDIWLTAQNAVRYMSFQKSLRLL